MCGGLPQLELKSFGRFGSLVWPLIYSLIRSPCTVNSKFVGHVVGFCSSYGQRRLVCAEAGLG